MNPAADRRLRAAPDIAARYGDPNA